MRFGRVFGTHNGSSTLTDVTGPWPVSASLASQPRRFVSRVVIDPNNSNVAYVTFATYCRAVCHGELRAGLQDHEPRDRPRRRRLPTWTPASSGIPDVPVNAFVVDPRDSSQPLRRNRHRRLPLDQRRRPPGRPYGTGLPRVAVFDMALHAPSGTLRVATHGRGIWEIAAGNATPALQRPRLAHHRPRRLAHPPLRLPQARARSFPPAASTSP